MPAFRTIAVTALLMVLSSRDANAQGAPPSEAERNEVRQAISEVNARWSRIRLDYDSARANELLTPDFYVQFRTRLQTREEFIRGVGTRGRLTIRRFDNPVLTVRRDSAPGEWSALVEERIEMELAKPDGSKDVIYSLWITLDTYRRTTSGAWMIRSSTEVMQETWGGGNTPPFADWKPRSGADAGRPTPG